MPPIKSRMMGLQPADSAYRVVRSFSYLPEKKKCEFDHGPELGMIESNEKLKTLRIPEKLCKNFLSVKSFIKPGEENVPGFKSDLDCDVKTVPIPCRRSRSSMERLGFQLLEECEAKFPGIIWDIGFLSSGDVFICYGDGIAICNRNFVVKTMLDHIKLAGGVAVMPCGNFVAIDRFNDTVNLYSCDGNYISSFAAGSSPMNVAVTKDNFIAVTDIGDKCVRVYSIEGTLLNTIAQKGRDYELQWPLYIQINTVNSFVVSDVLQKKIFIFNEHGSYIKSLQLKTYGANSVLRPHGIWLGKNGNFFVVDNALNTIELFQQDENYIHTLLSSEEGSSIKPKVLSTSEDGYLIVGGMTGTVKLFKFIESFIESDMKECDINTHILKQEQQSTVWEDAKQSATTTFQDNAGTVEKDEKVLITEYKMEFSKDDCVIVID